MKKDMLKCNEGLKSEHYADCKKCSWGDIVFGDESFCTIGKVRNMVIGEKGDGNV
ncbi:MAG: hypothetical protein ACOYBA_04680 [Coprococcus sp.]